MQLGAFVVISGDGASYAAYSAILSQSGTDAPSDVILENTLEDVIVWTRSGTGFYTGTLAGAFTENKTACFTPSVSVFDAAGDESIAYLSRGSDDTIVLEVRTPDASNTDEFFNMLVTVHVYP